MYMEVEGTFAALGGMNSGQGFAWQPSKTSSAIRHIIWQSHTYPQVLCIPHFNLEPSNICSVTKPGYDHTRNSSAKRQSR